MAKLEAGRGSRQRFTEVLSNADLAQILIYLCMTPFPRRNYAKCQQKNSTPKRGLEQKLIFEGEPALNQNISLQNPFISDLCRRYHVRELSIFGSALRDDFDLESDIDLLVDFMPEAQIGYLTLLRMQREFSTLLNRRVDLVPKGGLKPKIRKEIISQAQVIYAA